MFGKRWAREWYFHAMLLPAVALVLIYCYGPMAGMAIAFEKYVPAKGIIDSKWVGLANFDFVLSLPDTYRVLYNTVFIAFMKMVCGLIAPLTTALLLNELRKIAFKRVFQTLIYLPHFLSWIILGGILLDILSPSSGLVNQVLKSFGIEPVFFLGDNRWFPFVLVATDVWKEFGFGTIVYLAALTGINPALYEAAEIDGAGRWKQTLNVTLPGIVPIIVLLSTLSLGQILNAGFDQVFNLYNSQVYESGDIIDTLVYRLGLEQYQYGVATAIGLFKSVVSFLFISLSYALAYRYANYRIF
ncbi:putative aldouronate transport system permease protein [Paenibacillus sp. UNC496MF]|uniref:ABC transporter permease n=1 Tax=Paenibacillus sp. UNC496MF TaxID=1502753 RepID=UPI0008EBCCBF|nr:ABC transporter permease subunit [Paenibacillus sp. UNC496MF]SFJ80389.1 putative aldouronate transport system permease protein [Paenibacillus sp. UNC496MF]